MGQCKFGPFRNLHINRTILCDFKDPHDHTMGLLMLTRKRQENNVLTLQYNGIRPLNRPYPYTLACTLTSTQVDIVATLHLPWCAIYYSATSMFDTSRENQTVQTILHGLTCVKLTHVIKCPDEFVSVSHVQIRTKNNSNWVKVSIDEPLPAMHNGILIRYPWGPKYWPRCATEMQLFYV